MDSFRRFEILLKKTENFSRKLSSGDVVSQAAKKRTKAVNPLDHRHKMTEEEEDKELLEQESRAEDLVIFDKSPFFIKNGEMRDYQVRGLNWLIQLQRNGFSGILADEMVSGLSCLAHFLFRVSAKHCSPFRCWAT